MSRCNAIETSVGRPSFERYLVDSRAFDGRLQLLDRWRASMRPRAGSLAVASGAGQEDWLRTRSDEPALVLVSKENDHTTAKENTHADRHIPGWDHHRL
jgi:hypothetical protein